MNAVPQIETEAAEPADEKAFADLHLVHVVRQYAPMVGGLEDFVRNLAANQMGRFASIKVLTLDRLFTDLENNLPEQAVVDGIPVQRIPFRGSTRYPFAPSVFSKLQGADLVHVHAIDFFFDGLALTKPFHRKKLVATTHGGFFHTDKNSGLKKVWLNTMTRLSSQMYDVIACCSDNDLEMFRQIAPSKVRLIENGVDLSKFGGASSPTPQKRLVTIGRFSANKRLDRIFDAVQCLVRSDPQWQVDIVGSPSDLTASDLNKLITDRDLSGHAHVHLGLSDPGVRKILANCSFFVSASEYEGFGIALIEGLSAGLIPIVQPNTAYQSLSKHHAMVHLADFSNPDSAAETINRAWEDLIRTPSLRSSAISSADQHSWATTKTHYDRLYLDALKRGC